MRVAVTAANGQLSRKIIEALVNHLGADRVIGVARSPEKATDLGLEIRQGDYDEASQFPGAFAGVEVAVLISSMAPPNARIQQHRNVIEGAKAAGVRKMIYTSIFGETGKCSFDVIIRSNRQTENDIRASGLDWSIGRNGLYIDEDLAYLDNYVAAGKVENCGGDGRCAYTSREELAHAYLQMVCDDSLNGKIYTLAGEPVTQTEMVDALNRVYNLRLPYVPIGVDVFRESREAALGSHLGGIIGGIYQGIREGAFDVSSDYRTVCGREHKSVAEMAREYKESK